MIRGVWGQGSSGYPLSNESKPAAVVAEFEKLGQPTLDELCGQLTSQLRQQGLPAALCATGTGITANNYLKKPVALSAEPLN